MAGMWRKATVFAVVASVANALFEDIRLEPDVEHAPFLHGVASADPVEDGVLIWTRVSDAAATQVYWAVWELATPGQAFETPTQDGVAPVSLDNDLTVTVNVTGLEPGTKYAYQFAEIGGAARKSVEGRTKTISPDAKSVRVAYMSCTSLWSGYFNFYAHVAAQDLDAVLHMGDIHYPDMDPEELNRVPYGLCESKWFKGASEKVGGKPSDNKDPLLESFVASLDCEGSDLHRFRWTHALYLLDPDYRAARAAHPFIVTLDNHDLNGRTNTPGGSRQAALEWIPQRHVLEAAEDGSLFVNTLRNFRFGGDLLDIIMLDTYTFNNDSAAGLLGEGQHVWLDEVLSNSSRWRVFGSAKMFMPLALNGIPAAMNRPLGLAFLTFFLLLATCVGGEVALRSRRMRAAVLEAEAGDSEDLRGADSKLAALESAPEAPGQPCFRRVAETARRGAGALREAHKSSPLALRVCTCCGLVSFVVWTMIWIAGGIFLGTQLNSGDEIVNLDGDTDTWEGQPGSRDRIFDQLVAAGTTTNNFVATGDMHMSVAADLVRFDSTKKSTLLDYDVSNPGTIERFGVELLPSSGSRGNLDEKAYEIVGLLKPGSWLNSVASAVGNHVIGSANPHFRYFEGTEHGYGLIDVSPARIKAEIWQLPIRTRTDEAVLAQTLYLHNGGNAWSSEAP